MKDNIISKNVIILGSGITSLMAAYKLSQVSDTKITIISGDDDNWKANSDTFQITPFPTLAGPLGVETQSGQIWNGPDIKQRVANSKDITSNLYINEELSEYSQNWLKQFSEIDNSPNSYQKRSELLYKMNYFSALQMRRMLGDENEEIGLTFKGNLRLFSNQENLDVAFGYQDVIANVGGKSLQKLTKDECKELAPNLDSYLESSDVLGGVFYPEDGKLDGTKLYNFIRKQLDASEKVELIFNQQAQSINSETNSLTTLDGSKYSFTKCIIATGLGSYKLLTNLNLPIHPLWGWSCRIPFSHKKQVETAFTIGFNKECFIFSDYGDYIRVGGTTELMNFDKKNPKTMRVKELMLNNVNKIFGTQIEIESALCFAGARTMTVDDLPIIENLSEDILLTIPSGHLGILQSAGLADVITNFTSEQSQELNISDYSLKRFNHA